VLVELVVRCVCGVWGVKGVSSMLTARLKQREASSGGLLAVCLGVPEEAE